MGTVVFYMLKAPGRNIEMTRLILVALVLVFLDFANSKPRTFLVETKDERGGRQEFGKDYMDEEEEYDYCANEDEDGANEDEDGANEGEFVEDYKDEEEEYDYGTNEDEDGANEGDDYGLPPVTRPPPSTTTQYWPEVVSTYIGPPTPDPDAKPADNSFLFDRPGK